MANSVSRRAFLRQAACAPAAGVAGAVIEKPKAAWIIMSVNWSYNDEFTYEDGSEALPKVYFDQQQAEAECQRLCEEFYAGQTPLDFEVDFSNFYHDLPEGTTEETATWDQLRQAGFPAPYFVQELET